MRERRTKRSDGTRSKQKIININNEKLNCAHCQQLCFELLHKLLAICPQTLKTCPSVLTFNIRRQAHMLLHCITNPNPSTIPQSGIIFPTFNEDKKNICRSQGTKTVFQKSFDEVRKLTDSVLKTNIITSVLKQKYHNMEYLSILLYTN